MIKNCQQKSGVFLNNNCQNKSKYTCSICDKGVCNTHKHTLQHSDYCEDCYWEHFLLTDNIRPDKHRTDTNDGYVSTAYQTASSNTTSTSTSQDEGGFKDGFGGGSFGGGGAAGTWTEGDMESLNDTTEGANGLASGSDDTFFYS